MADPEPSQPKPISTSGRAWALVLGGMIVIGAANLYFAFRSMPDDFDENWGHADAGVAPDAAIASPSRP
ncbi:MAG TPA: hypothetical protein VML75_07000 [Kofleriaceae bacterium]|nr:hypothetical protein [Kofleriaceae bacterium]